MTGGDLFPGFAHCSIDTDGNRIFARVGGSGPPLLLLHSYPQSHVAWHRVAPVLARTFTIVAPDLRGYGASGCPQSDMLHRPYSKRVMALEMQQVMAKLGFPRFAILGHGRGGRVAYRLALERPQAVVRLAIVDILTTTDQWGLLNAAVDQRLSHWPLLAQPAPVPEALIGRDPAGWVDGRLKRASRNQSLDVFDPAALTSYRLAMMERDHIHATCEDHRAGLLCDAPDDERDLADGRKIRCPLLLVWASDGIVADAGSRSLLWRRWGEALSECTVDGGHYLAEENPAGLLDGVMPFLAAPRSILQETTS